MTPVIFGLGFRIFFLLAALFAVAAIGLWTIFYYGLGLQPAGNISATTWHAHEMVYGYGFAVIAGFLLTATRNWTGIQTPQGVQLFFLAGCWLLARASLALGLLPAAAVFDLLFAGWLTLAIARPIIRTRQWRQVAVVAKVLLLLVLNGLYYAGALGYLDDGIHLGIYGGLYLVIGLILMMGRRLVPFFVGRAVNDEFELPNSTIVDRAMLVAFLVFYVAELFRLPAPVSTWTALLLCAANAYRLTLWNQKIVWTTPLLWVLYLALWSITGGFLLLFLSQFFSISKYLAIHAMAYGGIGLMTVGMMARVTLGHTGRNVYEPPAGLVPVFLILVFGTLSRVLAPVFFPAQYLLWVGLSQALWIAAFVLFLAIHAGMLVSPRIDGKPG